MFVDIDPTTYNLDPNGLEAAITGKTKAILAVHQMGTPCDLKGILAIAERYHLPVVEDAACAVGSAVRVGDHWERIGRPHGAIACFSFHPRKILTTGEGGMLTTQSAEWDRQFRLLRQHAMSLSDVVRHSARTLAFEEYVAPGFNYRMTDIQAAVGRVQLRKLPELLARRREIAACYQEAFRRIDGLVPLTPPDEVVANYQSYPVRVTPAFPCTRNELMQHLLVSGISTRRGIMNAHQEPACTDYQQVTLPHSERARDTVILLPLYSTMPSAEVERVIEVIEAVR